MVTVTDEMLERLVAENRLLRKRVKTLSERVTAMEASRWWRAHPRFLLKRSVASATDDATASPAAAVKRHALIWKLRTEHERRNADAAPDELVIREGLRVRVHPDARPTLEEFCYSSPQQVEELDMFIAATADRRRLLDVGALHGVFSLVFAANPARRALAVDASPLAFAKLLYNIHRNRAENIVAVECALSNEPGTLEMSYESERAVVASVKDGRRVRVERVTGDRLCERYGFEPDVVKIDVDGHELRVVEGLGETLRQNRPLLFLEVHPQWIAADPRNGTLRALIDELQSIGYRSGDSHGRPVTADALGDLAQIDRFMLRPD